MTSRHDPKVFLYVFGIGLLMVLVIVSNAIPRVQAQAKIQPPQQPIVGSISSGEQAYSQALYFDSMLAKHPKTLMVESIEAPYLTTRQKFLDSRAMDSGFTDPKLANQAVWAITIKGEVSLSLPGTSFDSVYTDVTYIISDETGELVGVTTK
jgi:hypothetical protein